MFAKSVAIAFFAAAASFSGGLHSAIAEPLLEIEGGSTSEADVLVLDRADLEALPQHTIRTTTDWTDGVVEFRGPLARDVLALGGRASAMIVVVAANDYSVEIPTRDFEAYDVVFALEMDGRVLSLRDKGPIWIVYPRDEHAELQDPAVNARWVWQLERIIIQ